MVEQYAIHRRAGQRYGLSLGYCLIPASGLGKWCESKLVTHWTALVQLQCGTAELQQVVAESAAQHLVDQCLFTPQQMLSKRALIPGG
jgi:hypothetical protein